MAAAQSTLDDVRRRDVAQLEEPQRHERRAHARLDQDEDAQQRRRDREQPERVERRPALLVAVDDRVDGEHQRGGHRDRTRDVELALGVVTARGGQEPQREHEDGDADRDVDQEDPVPVEHVGEDAAEQHADGAAARGHEAEDAHRLGAVGVLGEEVHHEAERDRGGDRAAHALHGARRDQQSLRRREAAGQRRDGEERDADQEQPALAVEVAEAPAEQEEAAEGQQVGVHDPGERGRVEPEVVPDRGQRDIHDRRVEDDHQRAQAKDDQCVPACAAIQGHRAVPLGSIGSEGGPTSLEELIGRRGNSLPDEFRGPAPSDA